MIKNSFQNIVNKILHRISWGEKLNVICDRERKFPTHWKGAVLNTGCSVKWIDVHTSGKVKMRKGATNSEDGEKKYTHVWVLAANKMLGWGTPWTTQGCGDNLQGDEFWQEGEGFPFQFK